MTSFDHSVPQVIHRRGAVRLDALQSDEMRELVLDAWAMCVPKRVARDYFAAEDR